MRGYIFSFLLIAFAIFSADGINISYPSSQYYWVYGSTPNLVMWTSSPSDPAVFNIYLRNNNLPPLATGSGLALANNVATSLGKTNVSVSDTYGGQSNGTGFFIYFSHPTNASNIYATSELFQIMPNAAVYTTPSTPTPTAGTTDSSANKKSAASVGIPLPYKGLALFILLAVTSFILI
ncbi:9956_t:CDS:2 [Gigaspora rosea]|nr:9956_t:CDS:2 [Gigaspora rosea]